MFKNKNGISLVVLVITIIVLIIITGTVVLNMTGSNLITKAKEARFKNDLSTFNEELQITIAKQVLNGTIDDAIEIGSPSPITGLNGLKEYISSMNDNYANLLQIKEGQLEYIGLDTDEIRWASEIGLISDGITFTTDEPSPITPVEDIYHITKPEELIWVREQVNTGANLFEGKTVILDNDISLTGLSWTPIGTIDYVNSLDSQVFKGTFDGNNKKISNITYNTNQDINQNIIGLFSGNMGTIQNLTINNASFNIPNYAELGEYYCMAGITGVNGGTVTNCKSTGIFTSPCTNSLIAGICGANLETTSNCINSATISNSSGLGASGITLSNEGNIDNCNNIGNITSNQLAAGIVFSINGGNITRCYNTGTITSNNIAGGISGMTENSGDGSTATISRCYNSGIVISNVVGGIVGNMIYNSGNSDLEINIDNSYNTGNLNARGNTMVGGIIGHVSANSNFNINNCYVACTLTGTTVGGIIGADLGSTTHGFTYLVYLNTSATNAIGSVTGYSQPGREYIRGENSDDMKSQEMLQHLNDRSGAVGETYWGADVNNKNNGYPVLIY